MRDVTPPELALPADQVFEATSAAGAVVHETCGVVRVVHHIGHGQMTKRLQPAMKVEQQLITARVEVDIGSARFVEQRQNAFAQAQAIVPGNVERDPAAGEVPGGDRGPQCRVILDTVIGEQEAASLLRAFFATRR